MAKQTGTLVGFTVRRNDSTDPYPVVDQAEVLGGHHSKATLALRDAIPVFLRVAGMTCYVEETDTTYRLHVNLTSWAPEFSGGITLSQVSADGFLKDGTAVSAGFLKDASAASAGFLKSASATTAGFLKSADVTALLPLTKTGTVEVSSGVKAALAAQWPEAVTGGGGVLTDAGTTALSVPIQNNLAKQWPNIKLFVTPQEFGALGNNVSRPLSTIYGSLGAAQAVYPKATSLTQEIDGHAIQKALDTGRQVFLPDGIYRSSLSLVGTCAGQVMFGESRMRALIYFMADVDGFQIAPHSTGANLPNSTASNNNWGELRDLALFYSGGNASTTSKGVIVLTSSSNYNGEGWRLTRTHMEGFGTGYDIGFTSKFILDSTFEKASKIQGYYLHTPTVNCLEGRNVSCYQSPIGIKIENARGMIISLGDFAENGIGVQMVSGNAMIVGGELESASDVFFDVLGGSLTLDSNRYLFSKAPIRIDGRAYVHVTNQSWSPPGGIFADTYPVLAKLVSSSATITGHNPTQNAYDDQTNVIYHATGRFQPFSEGVGATRTISLIPERAGSAFLTSNMIGMQNREKITANFRGGYHHTEILANGDNAAYRAYLGGDNNLWKEYAGTNYTHNGWEDVIAYTGGVAKILGLRATNHASMRATFLNGKSLIVANQAATGNMTINQAAGDTINGSTDPVILAPRRVITLVTNGNGDWISPDLPFAVDGAPAPTPVVDYTHQMTLATLPVVISDGATSGTWAATPDAFRWWLRNGNNPSGHTGIDLGPAYAVNYNPVLKPAPSVQPFSMAIGISSWPAAVGNLFRLCLGGTNAAYMPDDGTVSGVIAEVKCVAGNNIEFRLGVAARGTMTWSATTTINQASADAIGVLKLDVGTDRIARLVYSDLSGNTPSVNVSISVTGVTSRIEPVTPDSQLIVGGRVVIWSTSPEVATNSSTTLAATYIKIS